MLLAGAVPQTPDLQNLSRLLLICHPLSTLARGRASLDDGLAEPLELLVPAPVDFGRLPPRSRATRGAVAYPSSHVYRRCVTVSHANASVSESGSVWWVNG